MKATFAAVLSVFATCMVCARSISSSDSGTDLTVWSNPCELMRCVEGELCVTAKLMKKDGDAIQEVHYYCYEMPADNDIEYEIKDPCAPSPCSSEDICVALRYDCSNGEHDTCHMCTKQEDVTTDGGIPDFSFQNTCDKNNCGEMEDCFPVAANCEPDETCFICAASEDDEEDEEEGLNSFTFVDPVENGSIISEDYGETLSADDEMGEEEEDDEDEQEEDGKPEEMSEEEEEDVGEEEEDVGEEEEDVGEEEDDEQELASVARPQKRPTKHKPFPTDEDKDGTRTTTSSIMQSSGSGSGSGSTRLGREMVQTLCKKLKCRKDLEVCVPSSDPACSTSNPMACVQCASTLSDIKATFTLKIMADLFDLSGQVSDNRMRVEIIRKVSKVLNLAMSRLKIEGIAPGSIIVSMTALIPTEEMAQSLFHKIGAGPTVAFSFVLEEGGSKDARGTLSGFEIKEVTTTQRNKQTTTNQLAFSSTEAPDSNGSKNKKTPDEHQQYRHHGGSAKLIFGFIVIMSIGTILYVILRKKKNRTGDFDPESMPSSTNHSLSTHSFSNPAYGFDKEDSFSFGQSHKRGYHLTNSLA